MKTAKTPDCYSAAVTARVISRLLRRAGFLMADTSDRFRWTEGVYVHRLGYSRLVKIDYHGPWSGRADRGTADERARAHATLRRALAVIEGKGYTIATDSMITVECERE